jgi:hypothetical protein
MIHVFVAKFFTQSKLVRVDDLRTFLMFGPDIHDIVRFKILHNGHA